MLYLETDTLVGLWNVTTTRSLAPLSRVYCPRTTPASAARSVPHATSPPPLVVRVWSSTGLATWTWTSFLFVFKQTNSEIEFNCLRLKVVELYVFVLVPCLSVLCDFYSEPHVPHLLSANGCLLASSVGGGDCAPTLKSHPHNLFQFSVLCHTVHSLALAVCGMAHWIFPIWKWSEKIVSPSVFSRLHMYVGLCSFAFILRVAVNMTIKRCSFLCFA